MSLTMHEINHTLNTYLVQFQTILALWANDPDGGTRASLYISSQNNYSHTCYSHNSCSQCAHTACAAAPIFTLCLKPEPSLLWLVSWPALLWLVDHLEMSRPLSHRCVGALAKWNPNETPMKHHVTEINNREKLRELWDLSFFRTFKCTTTYITYYRK